MNTIDFFRSSFQRLHNTTVDAVRELTPEQLNFRPEGHYSIAWVLWHMVRSEDVILRLMVQRKPELWAEGGWAAKLGLPERGQGTGHTLEQAREIEIRDLPLFLDYAGAVWADVDAYLAGLTEADLDKMHPWRRAEEPLGQIIGNHVMTHLFGHRNEIYWLRSEQGLQGSPT
ncbi:MAG TPA: DinB family protein [Dehalococcoidia bacterium]|nr:DinB family protein [Dehalococcoidia bacterium]